MHRRSIVYCAREESNYLLLRDRNEDIAIPASHFVRLASRGLNRPDLSVNASNRPSPGAATKIPAAAAPELLGLKPTTLALRMKAHCRRVDSWVKSG